MSDSASLNKEAWEEAFEKRSGAYADDILPVLRSETLPFLTGGFRERMLRRNLRGESVAQFGCNNGRELLSLCHHHGASGVGFDIAENMTAYAQGVSDQLGTSCRFVATDILSIDAGWNEKFDLVFATVGALSWFKDLKAWFEVAYRVLRPGGYISLHEQHPFLGIFD